MQSGWVKPQVIKPDAVQRSGRNFRNGKPFTTLQASVLVLNCFIVKHQVPLSVEPFLFAGSPDAG